MKAGAAQSLGIGLPSLQGLTVQDCRRFDRASESHVPRKEFFNAIDQMIGNKSKGVRQISFRTDALRFRRADHGVHRGG